MPARRRKPAPPPDIIERLVEAAVGTCTCGAKRPEPFWHHPTCRYKLLAEAAFEIERLRKVVAEVEAKPVTGKRAPDRRQASLMLPVKGNKK